MGEVEAEWEAASRYVRFARGAYSNAARAPQNIPTRAAVRAAGISAARRYAPSLLGSDQRMSPWRSRRRSYGGGRSRPPWAYTEPVPWFGGGDDYAGGSYGEPDQWWQGDDYESGESGEGEAPGRPRRQQRVASHVRALGPPGWPHRHPRRLRGSDGRSRRLGDSPARA